MKNAQIPKNAKKSREKNIFFQNLGVKMCVLLQG